MNKKEIKKALACCRNYHECENCPYWPDFRCTEVLCEDAYLLIYKQENEIRRLKAQIKENENDVQRVL